MEDEYSHSDYPEASLPPVPEVEIAENSPLPPLPPGAVTPPAPLRRAARRPSRRQDISSSDSDARPVRSPVRSGARASYRAPHRTRRDRLATQGAVALWVQGSQQWLSSWARARDLGHGDHASSPSLSPPSSADSAPPCPSSSHSSTAEDSAARPTTGELVPVENRLVAAPARQPDRSPGPPWDVSVLVSKSTVTVAFGGCGQRVLCEVSLAWLLSELVEAPVEAGAGKALRAVCAGHRPPSCQPGARSPLAPPRVLPAVQEQGYLKPRPPLPLPLPLLPSPATVSHRQPLMPPPGSRAEEGDCPLGPSPPLGQNHDHKPTRPLARRGVAVNKWTRRSRRRTTHVLRELFRESDVVSVVHRQV